MAWSQIRTFIPDPDNPKRVILNPAKWHAQPFELTMDRPNQRVLVPAGQAVTSIPLTARKDGPIELFYIKAAVFMAGNGINPVPFPTTIRWFLEHPGKNKFLMNRPVPLICCAGDAGRPYVLPETIFLPATQALSLSLFNDDPANDYWVEFAMGAIKFYPASLPGRIGQELVEYSNRRERTYTYWLTTDEDAILSPDQVNASFTITVPDDAAFEGFKLTVVADARFRARLRDGTNSDRALASERIDGSLHFGGFDATPLVGPGGGSGGVFPYRLCTTLMVPQSGQLTLELDNLSSNNNHVQAVIGGRKIQFATA